MKTAAPSHAPSTPRCMRTIALKFVFAASFAAIAFAATYTSASSAGAFSDSDLGNILALGAGTNILALLGAMFLLRRKNVMNAALSLIVLADMGTAYIVHTDLYLAGNWTVLILLCAMSFAGLFVAFRVIDESRWGGVALSSLALLGCWVMTGGNLVDRVPVSGDVSNIRNISFQRTPNLYFISFESIAPRSLLRKHLEVETTGFHDLFEDKMRRFSNFFANAVPTTNSLSTVLALEFEVYHSQRETLKKKDKNPNPYLFAGQNPSPLLDILHRNGYETTSIYIDSYLGKRKGPYIDNHTRFIERTVCNLLDPSVRNISFWGYCYWFDISYGWNNRNIKRNKWGIWEQELIVDEITKVSDNDGPQFVMAHLSNPGHTPKSFRHGNVEQLEKFRSHYIANSEEAARYLERIVRHLEENDPEAVLLVYGDHGPYLSRGLKFENDSMFVVQDIFGIMGGIYPRDACAVWLDETSAKGWMTILDAVHAILRCLSDGESALVEPRKQFPRYGPIPSNVHLNYEDLSYE